MKSEEDKDEIKIVTKEVPLEEEIRKLKAENEGLREDNKTLFKENKDLHDKLRNYEEQLKQQAECVNSLKNLAIQDREWLDFEVSQRREQMQQRRKDTEQVLAKRRASMNI